MDYHPTFTEDTICAISTAPGVGGIAVVRVSGNKAIEITDKIFVSANKKRLAEAKTQTLHFGNVFDNNNATVDEVLVSVFRAPHSFTGENTTEISCHGSIYIQQKILQLLTDNGCRLATPGEFTKRAFVNGKMDLSQAEAVADLIAANSEASHKLAINQMRGGISNELQKLRDDLLKFLSLIELELDFSTEDVEFADRMELMDLVENIKNKLHELSSSFIKGNAIKNGIPVAIVGKTNVGKSTILNWLLNDDKAIVSDVEGTTRDVIEDTFVLNGITFRLTDTAGLRATDDKVEKIGIERSYNKMEHANIILVVVDATTAKSENISFLKENIKTTEGRNYAVVVNKSEFLTEDERNSYNDELKGICTDVVFISAKENINKKGLLCILDKYGNITEGENVLVSNIRHYEALKKAENSIKNVEQGLDLQLSGDLLSLDIHECIDSLGEITGQISCDEVLGNIFKNFCIGK